MTVWFWIVLNYEKNLPQNVAGSSMYRYKGFLFLSFLQVLIFNSIAVVTVACQRFHKCFSERSEFTAFPRGLGMLTGLSLTVGLDPWRCNCNCAVCQLKLFASGCF